MNRIVRKRLAMAMRVRDFSRVHPSADANYAPVLAKLDDRIAHMESVAKQQQGGFLTRHASAVRRRDLRRRLHQELLRHLVTVAGVAGKESPALAERYVLPKGNATSEAFRTLGRRMLEQGQADRDALLAHGLTDTLLPDLAAALEEYDATLAESNDGKQDHIGARAELDAASDEVMGLVELLDGLNRYRYGSDAENRAAWAAARKVSAGPEPSVKEVVAAPGAGVEPAA